MRFQQAQDRLAQCRFAGTRLADDAKRLAALNAQADVIHRFQVFLVPPQNTAGQGEPDFQVIDLQHRFPGVAWQRFARRFGVQQQAAVRMLR